MQPHLPSDLGFYDLRVPEMRDAQAEMARSYGIAGFCYYHYWFHGRRLLNRPFDEVLASGRPDFPFCLCWANENWTRTWDGTDRQVLMPQQHSPEDDRAHFEHLLPAFRDTRYVRIDGKPLFLVYRTELLPDPARTAEIWRERAAAEGLGDLYLARVENFVSDVDPKTIGLRRGGRVRAGLASPACCDTPSRALGRVGEDPVPAPADPPGLSDASHLPLRGAHAADAGQTPGALQTLPKRDAPLGQFPAAGQ